MRPKTFLFVGGPEDGNLRALPSEQGYFAVAEIEREFYDAARYRPLSDDYVVTAPSFRTHHYRRETVALFGRRIDVMVSDRVRHAERDEAVMKHLLSPVALGLIGGNR